MPYAAHRRLPWVSLVVALGSLVTWALLHYAPYPALGVLAPLFGLTLHGTRRGSLVAFGATVATLAAALTSSRRASWSPQTDLEPPRRVSPGSRPTTCEQRRARWAALEESAA